MNRVTRQHRVLLLVALTVSGCIPIPIIDPEPYREEVIGGLAQGATRADVLFLLGAPAFVHDDERIFVYSAQQLHAIFIIILGQGTQGGVGGGGFGTEYLFVVQFDANGVVEQREVMSLGMGLGISAATGSGDDDGMIGHEETVCTSWQLCVGNGGADVYSAQRDADDSAKPESAQ